jgi:hypothetical protein
MSLLQRVATVFKPGAEKTTEATQERESAAGDSGQEGPAGPDNDSYNTNSERLRGIGTPRRRDLRDVDGHESWRGVASACHIDPDGHE